MLDELRNGLRRSWLLSRTGILTLARSATWGGSMRTAVRAAVSVTLAVGALAILPLSEGSAATRTSSARDARQRESLRVLNALERSDAQGAARPNAATSGPDCLHVGCFYYNAMAQRATATGASVTFTQAKPKIGKGGLRSVVQFVVESADERTPSNSDGK